MRLKRNRLHQYHHRQSISKRDGEGGSYTEYENALPFMAEMWPGGGKVQAEMYGTRLPNIRNLRIQGKYKEIADSNGKLSYALDNGMTITVNDGICIYSENEPDYKVVAIYPYSFLVLEVEKL